MQEARRYSILVAALGGHQVTMTNPVIGTVQVSNRGFYMFRDLVVKRGVVGKEDTQSDALCELAACFEAAKPVRNRDSKGNLLLRDKDTQIIFVVEAEQRILIASFDEREGRKKRRAKKRAAVPVSETL
jgi:hypothetical protein